LVDSLTLSISDLATKISRQPQLQPKKQGRFANNATKQ
jgi:hypothetical protein